MNKDFVIMTDASCDMPIELVEKNDVVVVPMSVTVNGDSYMHTYDYQERTKAQFYDALRNGATGSTAGANMLDIADAMREVAAQNKDILYIALSSGLSCSYQNATLAAEDVTEEYPECNIVVLDSLNVSMAMGLLVYMAACDKAAGKSLTDTVAATSERIPCVHSYFTVNDLSALQRSGRISHLSASMGSLLNIKPVLEIKGDGRVHSGTKARGRKMAIRHLIDGALNKSVEKKLFTISHVEAQEDVETISSALKEAYPDCEILVGDIGPIIGIHTGMKTIAVFYLGDKR
jgi:DegV family protein with EDD domain